MQIGKDSIYFAGFVLLLIAGAVGLITLVIHPLRGAVYQALDILPRAYWMSGYFNDRQTFPPKANLCAEPFCRRTDTRPVYVGGNPGHRSATTMNFCPGHTPGLPSNGTRHDGFLRFIYWLIALGLSLFLTSFLVFAAFGIVVMVIDRGLLAFVGRFLNRDFAERWQSTLRSSRATDPWLAAITSTVWLLAWVMFAWW